MRVSGLIILILAVLMISAAAQAQQPAGSSSVLTEPLVIVYPMNDQGRPAVGQGGVVLIEVRASGLPAQKASAKALSVNVPLYPSADFSTWSGLLGVDMSKDPGTYPITINMSLTNGKTWKKELNLLVIKREFGLQELTISSDKAGFSEETLAQVRDDNKAFGRLWYGDPSPRYFSGDFIKPVPGAITSQFGVRRIINGQNKSPHSGIDYRAAMGEPILAIEAGKVVLVRSAFFAGNAVVVDHGANLFSMYFHLSEINVETGQIVAKGEIVGLGGMTGRATGPHLHFGLRLNGAKVDPEALFAMTPLIRQVEQ